MDEENILMEKLAIEGGVPVRDTKIYYGKHWISEEDIQAVSEVLRSDYLTCGPKIKELERELEKHTAARYAVAVSSGTAALHCACMAAGVQPGDEVITTPLTFAASANCALYCGARPVFADVDLETYNIQPESIEEHVTDKTKAVVSVDFTGQAAELKKIREICKKHGLVFIEDAAHAIGTKYNDRPVGSVADMTCFSFHPVKTITAGEGGAVTTNQESLYKKLGLVHAHGITHNADLMENVCMEGGWYYEQINLGYNYRITDFQAALLLSQLHRLEKFKLRRKQIAKQYDAAFNSIPEIIGQKEIQESDTCRHLYIIRLDLDKLACSRQQFYDAMAAENVQCQVHYIPVYWFPYYRHLGYERGLCPNAEKVYEGIMSIPLYPGMTDQDVEDVIHAVKKVVENYRK